MSPRRLVYLPAIAPGLALLALPRAPPPALPAAPPASAPPASPHIRPRDPALLVPRYYVFLPAFSFGQESTVSVITPSDSAWEVNLEPGGCGAGPVFACQASSADGGRRGGPV